MKVFLRMNKRKKEELKAKVNSLKKMGIQPKLSVVLASEDEASKIYVGKKRKMCEELGIEQDEHILDESVTTDEVVDIINTLNKDKSVNGILRSTRCYSMTPTIV